MVNKVLNQRKVPSPDHIPKIMDQVMWARALRHRLDRPMEVCQSNYDVNLILFVLGTLWLFHINTSPVHKIKTPPSQPPFFTPSTLSRFHSLQVLQKAYFMPKSHSYKQIVSNYGQIVQVLDEIVGKSYSEWSQKLDGLYLKKLEQPLLVRSYDTPSKLDINFDK